MAAAGTNLRRYFRCQPTSVVPRGARWRNLDAISAADRPRYNELRRMLAASVAGKRELPNGVALQISTDRIALAQLAEWISFERKCCPFFDFAIEVSRESGPVFLSLTGRDGVKAFLAEAFSG